MDRALKESNDWNAATLELPVTFKPHPVSGWVGGFMGLFIMGAGALALRYTELLTWFGAGLILLGGCAAFPAFMSLRRESFALTLTRQGFEFTGVFRRTVVAWHDVEKFLFIPRDETDLVGWQYTQRSGRARPESKRRAAYQFADEMFPTGFRRISQRELADLLNALRRQRRQDSGS